ncbi:peptidase M49 [bacterium (candidate division B38) B3_B38]|nr:MAG: peptidase M49 [bacterium (candidate division B38) B3_B38]
MIRRGLLVVLVGFFIALLIMPACKKEEVAPTEAPREYLLEQVGKTAIVRLYADGFEQLDVNDQILAYYLYQAAIAGRDICYDQNHRHALEIRDILEGIVTHPEGIDPTVLKGISDYTKLFWANTCQYDVRTMVKFVPEVSYEDFLNAATIAQVNGADFYLKERETLEDKLARLRRSIFDADYEPMVTNKNPPPGQDIITGSANNLYEGVTEAELKAYKEKYPLNSKVVKIDRRIVEQVYRAGTNGIKPGLYAEPLREVISNLEKAIPYAGPRQQETLQHLVSYFKSGDPEDFRKYNIAWVGNDPVVDTINGFIEVYKDARGVKGEYEALVSFVDQKTTKMMKDLAAQAQYFEDRQPWDEKYKKKEIQIPVANAISVLIAVGGVGPISPAGINLPNAQDIRETYGSKNFLLSNAVEVRRKAVAGRVLDEFALTEEEKELSRQYGAAASDVLIALHEIIGHGSGKVSEKLTADPSEYLKEYYSTMEEARADVVALYHIWDPKLVEIGALPSSKCAEASYHSFARGDLLMLRRIKTGDRLEEDHMRGEHMIVNYLKDKVGAIEEITRDGKVYLVVKDMQMMREGVGELLAELMRIKAEGDYEAIKELVNTYGIKINTEWRDQVIQRTEAINYPSQAALIMPRLTPVLNENGEIVDITISYTEDFTTQNLEYSGKK